MNWFELVNKASAYIEENLRQKLDLKDIAKECNVSYHHFARVFSMMTGYSLKEYIRNRRITLASYEVSNTNRRIIDIALKYGYSSNEAFTRAFKKIHDVNPSEARKNGISIYTHFPVIRYEVPSQNLISLRYDLVYDLCFSLHGMSTHIIENDYEETQEQQNTLVEEFSNTHKCSETIYRVHHSLREDNLEYDYFVGCSSLSETSNTQSLDLKIDKAVRFISNKTTKEMIPKLKKIVYDEWEKCRFRSTFQCELEYTTDNEDGTVNFYYIVSIK